MKRHTLKTTILAGLILAGLASAGPVLADSKISGYYRMQMISDNLKGAPAENKPSEAQVDNRLRIRYQNNLNEYVHFVYYGEVDTLWGQPSKGNIGGGGQAGADGVNVETKNAYLDFKIPETIWGVRTGIQGFADNIDHLFIADDWAGIRIDHKFTPAVTLTTAYFKAFEGNTTQWDESDLYALQARVKVNDSLGLTFDGYYNDDNRNSALLTDDLYLVAAGAQGKIGSLGLEGWIAYEFGEQEPATGPTVDIAALAGTVKASLPIGPAETALRLIYFSSDDDAVEDQSWNGPNHADPAGKTEFDQENLMIFLTDYYYTSTEAGRHALTDAAYAGYGLFGINAKADFKLPGKCYLKTGLGYFMALEDTRNGEASKSVEGTDLGLEVAARVGTKVAELVDVSLAGAYAMLGSFYEAPGSNADPDDLYKVNFMIDVKF